VLLTIGHGDRTLEDLVDCLASFEVETVVDVRSYPTSRHHPRFSREELEPELTRRGFIYRWLGRELGGFRAGGYEAHMETELFAEGLRRLLGFAAEATTAILCAERNPTGCHRAHIAKAVEEKGVEVRHIITPGRTLSPGDRPGDQGTLF
jgi:uncharacterized protein (DUF488 family)